MDKPANNMMPAPFAPLYINKALFESRKALALFEFTRLFFPQHGPTLVNLLLDMENQSRRVIVAAPLKERERLIHDLDGVTVELKCMIQDRGREMMTLPVTLVPAEVLRRAAEGKSVMPDLEKQRKAMERIIIALIEKEVRLKIKLVFESCLKPLMVKPRLPAVLKELIGRGLVSRDGRLADDTTIMDLLSGRYKRLFADRIPEEVLNEARLIQHTLQICARGPEDYPALVQDALRVRRMLEITLKAMRPKQDKEKRDIPEVVSRHGKGHLRRTR